MFDLVSSGSALPTLALVGLQLAGLCTILLARLPIPHRLGLVAFVGCLLALGAVTYVTFANGGTGWAPCGTVFGLMIVGATFDGSPGSLTAGA